MRNLRSHLPKREPRANCRSKTKPSSGHDHAAGIRNSFDFAARLVGGGRTVHPVSRVFRGAFHGLRVTRTVLFEQQVNGFADELGCGAIQAVGQRSERLPLFFINPLWLFLFSPAAPWSAAYHDHSAVPNSGTVAQENGTKPCAGPSPASVERHNGSSN
jgi:hypothetical protein